MASATDFPRPDFDASEADKYGKPKVEYLQDRHADLYKEFRKFGGSSPFGGTSALNKMTQ